MSQEKEIEMKDMSEEIMKEFECGCTTTSDGTRVWCGGNEGCSMRVEVNWKCRECGTGFVFPDVNKPEFCPACRKVA